MTTETDPTKNATADRIVRIVLGEEAGDPAQERNPHAPCAGVSQEMLDAAGTALANRYYFAIDGTLTVTLTPIRYFENAGRARGEPEPVRHLLPGFESLTSSTWGAPSNMSTPGEVARFMTRQGFTWCEDFQDILDPSVTAEISVALAADAGIDAKMPPRRNSPPAP